MIGTIAAGASIAGSIFGGVSSFMSARKQQKALDAREDEIESWYKQEMNTDVLDTSSSKSALSQLRKQNDSQMEKMNNSAVKRGMTSEAQVAMASDMNENYADAMTKIAAHGDERKNSLYSSYQAEKDRIDDMRSNISAAKGSALSSLVGNISGVAGSILENEAASGTLWNSGNKKS